MTHESKALAARLLAARAFDQKIRSDEADWPKADAQGYAVQAEVAAGLGEIGGWKVGAAGPDAPPSCASLPASGILPSGQDLDARFSDRLVEAEIAFRMAADLPPRDKPYTHDEVIAAIGTAHPVIEVVQWRIQDGAMAPGAVKLADHIGHGALIVGDAIAGWPGIDFPNLAVTQEIEGKAPAHGRGNPGGDMIRLIAWLADEGAVWAGGLKAGQIVTCGSWTGCLPAPVGSSVRVTFAGTQPVSVRFA